MADQPNPAPDQDPKIIVDSDWKSQAQAERDRMAAEEAQSAAQAGQQGLPEADFKGLIEMLAAQALMYLGGMPDQQGRAMFEPSVARHIIDLLAVVEDKTKGNLTGEESKMLSQLLNDLRARYVELARMVAAQQAQGGGPGAAPGGGPAGGPSPIIDS